MTFESRPSTGDGFVDRTARVTYLMHWSAGGNAEQVNAILGAGADVNAVDREGDSALYYAASNCHGGVAQILLEHGADPNAVGASGPALVVAAGRGATKLVRRLIAAGADVNAQDASGATAMMPAAAQGYRNIIDMLCRARADLETTDEDGDTALFYAATRGQVEAVDQLLQHRANPSPRPGSHGHSPLIRAAYQAALVANRQPAGTAESFRMIVHKLIRVGADYTSMYNQGLFLIKHIGDVNMAIDLVHVPERIWDGDLDVTYLPPGHPDRALFGNTP